MLDIASRKLSPSPIKTAGRWPRRSAMAQCRPRGTQRGTASGRPGTLGEAGSAEESDRQTKTKYFMQAYAYHLRCLAYRASHSAPPRAECGTPKRREKRRKSSSLQHMSRGQGYSDNLRIGRGDVGQVPKTEATSSSTYSSSTSSSSSRVDQGHDAVSIATLRRRSSRLGGSRWVRTTAWSPDA